MTTLIWLGFLAVVLVCLALDLGVFHRAPHVIRTREAFMWTGVWVTLAVLFSLAVHYAYANPHTVQGPVSLHDIPPGAAVQLYFTAYLVEYSLSLDNIVVMALIFTHFCVPHSLQHRVLFWGVLGAIVMRFCFIVAGSALLSQISWVSYVFGGLLLLSAARMLFSKEGEFAPEKNIWVRGLRQLLPVHDAFEGASFFTRCGGRVHATRLFIVLLLVEGSDLIFAVDSIPAALAITSDPFLVFTSNIFAVMGLRSLYFALAPLIERFRYLKLSLVFLLGFVGAKLLLHDYVEIDPTTTLMVIGATILFGVLASLFRGGGAPEPAQPPSGADPLPAESDQRRS